MLRPIRLDQAHTVVEFGPGTGPMTRDLLAAMPEDSRLFAFEISPRFAEYLREFIDDPRLILVEDSAENLGRHLRSHGVDKVDAVVSSLGLTIMPEPVRAKIFEALMGYIHDDTVVTQFQYLHGLVFRSRLEIEQLRRFNSEHFLRRHFQSVTSDLVWRNLPPAVVYTCKR